MLKNLTIIIAFFAHYGSSDLAKPHAMPPTCSFKDKFCGHSVLLAFFFHDKCRAVKMRRGERAAYFQFLANDTGFLRADDTQAVKAAGCPARHRLQVDNVAIVHT